MELTEQIVRAFWRRIYVYRNDYDGNELPGKLPIPFQCSMGTALTLIDDQRLIEKNDTLTQRISEQAQKISELEAEREWQDIESIPLNNKSDYSHYYVAWGPDNDKSTGHATRYKDKWFAAGEFYKGGSIDGRQYKYEELEIKPTHYLQSLPSPPTVKGASNGR
jgi:hypothetical protein